MDCTALRCWRVFNVLSGCVLVSALAACAGSMSTSNSSSAHADPLQLTDQAQTTHQAAESNLDAAAGGPSGDLALNTAPETSRILMTPGRDSFGVELVDSANTSKVIIQTPSDKSHGAFKYEVSKLDAPPRIVIDLKGTIRPQTKVFDTADSELVSKVRVGAHPDKSRVVIDLPEGLALSHRVDGLTGSAGEGLVVTLARESSPEQFARNKKSSEAQGAAEQADKKAKSDATGAPLADAGVKPSVVGLTLEPLGSGQNMMIAQVSSSRSYSLKRTAPSEFVLNIENAGLEPAAAMTLLAPQGAGSIRSVRPVVQGNDVLVRIFSSPHTNLVARENAGRIVVSAGGSADEADFRAQAKPEEAKPAEKAPEVTKGAEPEVLAKNGANGDSELDAGVSSLLDESPKYTGRLISLDLQDTDIDNALRIIAEVSNLNIIASQDVAGKVTLRLIDVPWDQALDVILKTNGLDKVQEGNVVRIAPVEKLRLERESLKQAQQAEEELEPLQVRYVRISYAKAAELKPLVESVLSERGSVTYDERTNQLIIKDIKKGIKNVAELVSKLDLRTPQVLLETQIVEANRNLLRDLGAEVGFHYVQSPATGNATGSNFPNSIVVGGSASNTDPGTFSSFPADGGSAISFLLDSADATKGLSFRISALENEGRIRVISRPAVATTNNKQATIKSIEKIRVKTPSGGLSVATGSGASASGSSAVATESIEIGIILEVTPQASPDYYVLLDINAKSSTIGSQTVDGIPSEIERSATSSVLVSSGQTFAMGGIYKIRDRDSVDGVPFFKDIPVIGYLFRRQKVDNSDEELLFFLTPRIIEGSFDDAAMKASA